MATRVHKALSMMPEDLERLQRLSTKAGMTESQYIRTLLKVQEAKLEGKEDVLRIMSDRENKESPSGNEEGGQGSEARFLTESLPKTYLYWEAIKIETEETFLYPIQKENWMDASWELKPGFWIGCNSTLHNLTRQQAARKAVELHQDYLDSREELKRMGIIQ